MIIKRMRIETSPLPVLKVLGLNPNGVTFLISRAVI